MDLGHLYTSFDGRINRQPYWIAAIILALVNLVISLVVGRLLGVSIMPPDFRFMLVSLVLTVLFLYPAAALMVKRLHDRDRPAWLAALFLAAALIKSVTDLIGMTGNQFNPNMLVLLLSGIGTIVFAIVGIWAFVELGCLRGSVGTNQYGPDPLGGSEIDAANDTPWTPSLAKSSTGLRGSDYFKKCPACGKFTRDAKVCRICGHDLTYSVSDAPRIETRNKPPTTPGTSEL
ncbi:MAG: DUF805 domain-containing protein [Mycobacterium sp.]|uniref:DUF805 domain-containing protein n=1 Tax=Mycobacterium sp. TaxID=1785 RepID=UPI003BB07E60